MSLYTERWIARPVWLALSIPERIAYLDQMEAGMRAVTDAGAQLLGLVLKEERRLHSDSCRYVAVWAVPDGTALGQRLEAVLDDVGWGRYFDRAEPSREHGTEAARPTRSEGLAPSADERPT